MHPPRPIPQPIFRPYPLNVNNFSSKDLRVLPQIRGVKEVKYGHSRGPAVRRQMKDKIKARTTDIARACSFQSQSRLRWNRRQPLRNQSAQKYPLQPVFIRVNPWLKSLRGPGSEAYSG